MGKGIVAKDVEVRLPDSDRRPDREIARNAIKKLQVELPYSSQFIMVTAEDGRLTVEGTLEWNYQRNRG